VIFLAAASVPTAAETVDDGGRLVIGQGANSCWAWTRSQEAKTATQGLYTQWVAGFVSGVSWEADDSDILTRMDFDGLTAWMNNYCKANPLAKVTTRRSHARAGVACSATWAMRRRIYAVPAGKDKPRRGISPHFQFCFTPHHPMRQRLQASNLFQFGLAAQPRLDFLVA
jgi:hypothetical protein